MITKVNDSVKHPVAGWEKVLFDLNQRIQTLQDLVPIVERKIRQGEPWSGGSCAD